MPYKVVGKCVHKVNADGSMGDTVPGGCHDTPEEAQRHARALYANVKSSEIAEMSLVVVKAYEDKSEKDPNRRRRILLVSSDTQPDLYEESMSIELFRDFIEHIENNDPIPEAFKSVVCEDSWCGGMPYISIAHYRAGSDSKNVPGTIESVYVDGNKFKSKAYLHETPLGIKLFEALHDDIEKHKSGVSDHLPVRVSIGFLDLQHVHVINGKSFVFNRTELGQKCDLCEKGSGGKIYKKGYLVHEAATRVPVNQRTEMALEEKSMDEILTKKDDAASIVGEELAKELEQKSLADDVLVIKSEDLERKVSHIRSEFYNKFVPPRTPKSDPWLVSVMDDSVVVELDGKLYKAGYSSEGDQVSFDDKKKWQEVVPGFIPKSLILWERSEAGEEVTNTPYKVEIGKCYDPNTNSFDQGCIDGVMNGVMTSMRSEMHTAVKSAVAEMVEDAKRKDVSESDKKRAEKEYGDVKYADETNKKYPIDTEEHVRAALSYWGMPKNRAKYSPEDQKKIGARIRAAAKKFGIDATDKKSDVVEESMDEVVVQEAKAKADEAEQEDNAEEEGQDAKDSKKDEMKKSLLDTQYEALKSAIESGKPLAEVQAVFNSLGQEVEKSISARKPADPADLAEMLKSAVEAAVAPLRLELAQIKATQGKPAPVSDHPVSRALTLKPEQLVQRSQPANEQLTQIQKLARQSVGLQ